MTILSSLYSILFFILGDHVCSFYIFILYLIYYIVFYYITKSL